MLRVGDLKDRKALALFGGEGKIPVCCCEIFLFLTTKSRALKWEWNGTLLVFDCEVGILADWGDRGWKEKDRGVQRR